MLTAFEAAAELRRMGLEMTREITANLRAWHPDGVPEDQLQALHDRLTGAQQPACGGRGAA